jgi:hypothetical protein
MQANKLLIEAVQSDIDLQLHILSHFTEIDDPYREQLLMLQAINSEEIDEKLAMSGSKFYPDFARNPDQLADRIITGLKEFKTESIQKGLVSDMIIHYPQKLYPEGIGVDGIAPISELNNKEVNNIKTVKRSEFEVRTLKAKMPPAWQLNLIFEDTGNPEVLKIKTIFPGRYAPPFPDSALQAGDDYRKSKEFWNNHVFIIPA